MSLALAVRSTHLAPGLDASLRSDGATTVLDLRGEADGAGLAVLVEAFARITADGTGDVVVDLSGLEFMDIATVRAVMAARASLAGDGRQLTLRSPSRVAARVLEMFGLAHLVGSPGEGALST